MTAGSITKGPFSLSRIIIHNDGEVEEDIEHRLKAGWFKLQ